MLVNKCLSTHEIYRYRKTLRHHLSKRTRKKNIYISSLLQQFVKKLWVEVFLNRSSKNNILSLVLYFRMRFVLKIHKGFFK